MTRTIGALAFALLAGAAAAQGYPSKPVTLVNAFPPGGATDIVARQIAAKLSQRFGQQVVVDNRAGAAGTIGAASVARAEPDGYTMLFAVAANLAVAPAVLRVPYDPVKSFAPVVEIARGPYVLMVHPSVPTKDLAAFVAYARQHPGKLNYGTPGQGSVHHLATEMLKQATGIDIVHVPYKGGAPMYTAITAGEVQILLDGMPAPLPHVRAGKVRALGVTGDRRLGALPDVRSFAEQGVSGVDAQFWWGIVVPAGTPQPIITRLNAEVTQALADPEVKATFEKQNIDPSPGTPEAFGTWVAAERTRWAQVVAKAGIKPE
ncbi:MAG TPA: tripartite tricarboxylate transporter substrate binding protein [Burkholderiales bacterium]|nr:tripartite tricarboxylate transporter substrate binding protein [Burkholderiales bacterium]